MSAPPIILMKRKASGLQKLACKIIWWSVFVASVILAVSIVVQFDIGVLDELRQQIRLILQPLGFYIGIICFGLIVASWKLCLHDLVSRGDKESIVINDDEIRRIAVAPLLSFLSDVSPFYGSLNWNISRTALRRLVVRINEKNLDLSTLEIHHAGGSTWLLLTDWEYRHAENQVEDFFRGLRRTKCALSDAFIKRIPLVSGLLEKKYPLEFQSSRVMKS